MKSSKSFRTWRRVLFHGAWLVLASARAAAADALPITQSPGPGDFVLIGHGAPTAVIVDGEAHAAVKRVAGDLAADLARVSGAAPATVHNVEQAATTAILVGVLGESGAIDRLVRSGRLASHSIDGQWESALVQTVTDPWPGVHQLLVVAGSDRRGAIYGAYSLSSSLGVSPWSWWADVPVRHLTSAALPNQTYLLPSPKVRFRGIFLNDEDWTLRPWASQTDDPATGNIGPKTYGRIFELLLRLRGNLLWPAMHPGTRAFNFYVANAALADSYGVVMGSSHAEPMLRDNVDEWGRDGKGEFNYVTNRAAVLRYWDDRVRSNGRYDNIYTVGMRGIHDSGMAGGGSVAERAERLRQVIADQRALLQKDLSKDPSQVPQMFCPYKEVLPLYESRPSIVPGDVTLVWPDDNFGYIQHFSTPAELARSGGAGVYYHISYWGAPYDHLWLPSTPPALIGEEMSKAARHGAARIWVVNVGGLKPREWETEFFLGLAWNPEQWHPATGQSEYLQAVAVRDFGAERGREIATLMGEYYRLNFQRRPEYMGEDPKSRWLARPVFEPNGEQSDNRARAFIALRQEADAIAAAIDAPHRAAFFELVQYPVQGAALMNLKWLDYARGQATQEPKAAETCYRAAAGAQLAIDGLVRTYAALQGGKWAHMASSHPRDQRVFNLPLPPSAAAAAPLAPEAVWDPPVAGAAEQHEVVSIAATGAQELRPGQSTAWEVVNGIGYRGSVLAVRAGGDGPACPALATAEYRIAVSTAGVWRLFVRLLPTWPLSPHRPASIKIAVDDGEPTVLTLPDYTGEKDPRWQSDVLRNCCILSTSGPLVAGSHVVTVQPLEPGPLIDSILLVGPGAADPGYVWPEETSAAAGSGQKRIRIAIASDSTAATWAPPRPERGWGQYLSACFDSGIEIQNLAKSGASTSTFVSLGRWAAVLASHPDIVLIQFGHNDSHSPDHHEHTDPDTLYSDLLRRFVSEARAVGAQPILITPVSRRNPVDTLLPYVAAVKRVGAQTGTPVIDLHQLSAELYARLGAAAQQTVGATATDHTHFNAAGATLIAGLVADALAETVPLLRTHRLQRN